MASRTPSGVAGDPEAIGSRIVWRSGPLCRPWVALALTLCLCSVALSAGCGEESAPPAGTTHDGAAAPGVDSQQDDLAEDQGVTSDVQWLGGDVELVCPGGAGCPCATNNECDNALCIDTPDGRQCAQNCSTSCPDGFKCVQTPVSAGDLAIICVPAWGKLCNPCLSSQSCSALGQAGASCVVHGDAGAFCGADCSVDQDCPAGFSCKELPTVEGTQARQCVPAGSAGVPGLCSCSKAAIAAQLSTSCVAKAAGGQGGCPGQRACSSAGLSACTGAAFGDEVCDGLDNDCDGVTDEGSCDDSNPCTVDLCAPASPTESGPPAKGACSHEAGGAVPCNADNSACTEDDHCVGTQCLPGKVIDCSDNNPCTNDACDIAKGCTHAPQQGAGCDDGNPCTIGDTCQNGQCQAGAFKNCPVAGACEVGKCDVTTGKCGIANAEDGLPCNDGTLCTDKDGCAGGSCKGKVQDCDDANPCTNDGCDAKSGCTHTPSAAVCTDSNACTDGDHCDGGECVTTPKAPGACDDANPCTLDGCEVSLGCAHTPTDGTCDDGDICTTGDACAGGACVPGGLTCPCQKDNDCAPKEDGDFCNGTLVCKSVTSGKVCAVDPTTVVDCDTSKDTACLQNLCDPADGVCKINNIQEGLECDADGSVCTPGDTCILGLCKAGKAVDCDDKNPCTTDSCDKKLGCVNAPNTLPCDADGTACTASDTCNAKVCLAGKAVNCNDNKPCTVDACDPKTGACSWDGLPKDGTPCDADGSVCTQNDLCSGGDCLAGKKLQCDDGNVCTADSCSPLSGCVKAPANGFCDADGTLCTKNDACSGGVCKADVLTLCDDKKACTKDSCDPKTGTCTYDMPGANGTACDADGSICTVGDNCQGGLCLPGPTNTCDDGKGCTVDTCDPKTGCAHATAADDAVCAPGKVCKSGDCVIPYACNYAVDTTYGSPGNDRAMAVLSDAAGFVLGATTEGKLGGKTDGWLVRLNTAGKLVWTTPFGGVGTDEVRDVVASASGWVTAGWTNSKGAGGMDAWLARIDSKGALQWELTVGGTADDWARGIAADSAGVMAVGTSTVSAAPAALILRADLGGIKQWSKTIAGSELFDLAAAPGGFVAVGSVEAANGLSDGWVVKLDPAGNVQWTKTFGGAKADQLSGVSLLLDGLLIVGHTASKGAGGMDAWAIKLDPDGTLLWEHTYGSPADEFGAQGVATAGGFALVGYASSLLSGTGEDLLLVRTDELGNPLIIKNMNGSGDERGNGVAALTNGFALAAATTSKGGGLQDVWFLRTDPWFNAACPTASLCAPITPADCDDGKPCTGDWCSDAKGCTHAPVPCP